MEPDYNDIETLAKKIFFFAVTHKIKQQEEIDNEDVEGIARVSFEWSKIFHKEARQQFNSMMKRSDDYDPIPF